VNVPSEDRDKKVYVLYIRVKVVLDNLKWSHPASLSIGPLMLEEQFIVVCETK
jgi:hypothetical protein